MNHRFKVVAIILALGGVSCTSLFTKQVEWETIEPTEYPVITAVGYAPISAQKGQNDGSKMLLALKASKLDAYRELAEQVFGQKVDGEQSLANLVLDDARLSSSVQGVIRGAKVIKSYPVGNDTYATELELDFKLVHDLYLSTAKPQRVKKVRYY
jgi:outer membrane protein FlgP